METLAKSGTILTAYLSHAGVSSRRKAEKLVKQGLVTVNDVVVKTPCHRVQKDDVVVYTGKDAEESNASESVLSVYLSHAGVSSRRKATDLIKKGLVTVNDVVVKKPSHRLQKNDVVVYDGKKVIINSEFTYILLNKPRACITTTSDEKGRTSVMDLLSKQLLRKNLYPVGRLDCNTTGLLLLTNDGELANRLMHPKFNVKKTYLVRVHKPIEQKDVDHIKKGVRLPDGVMKFDRVSCYVSSKETRAQVTLHSGKKRIIRRVFETLGYRMCRLERVSYGNVDVKGLSRGEWRELTRLEIKRLRLLVKL